MAESPSSNPTFAETGEGAVADRIDGVSPAPEIVLGDDGVPVVDLREAAARDGALVVVDGVLLLRLADGTEWPIDATVAAGDVVLQVADRGFVAATAVQEVLAGTDTVLPLAGLGAATAQAADLTGETVADAAAIEPEAAGERPAHGGGSSFRAYDNGDMGPGLDPLLALGPTELARAGGFGEPTSGLFDAFGDSLAITGPDNGGGNGGGGNGGNGNGGGGNGGGGNGGGGGGGGSRFINLAPIANDDFAKTNERQSVDIDVLANDRDPNPGDRIRIVGIRADGLKGVVSLNPDGTINYDPNGQFTHLGKGEHATETFRYTIADQHGATNSATVTVKITGLNDAPVAKDDFAQTNEKSKVGIPVIANDYDPDANDVVKVVHIDTSGITGSAWLNPSGSITYSPDGKFNHLGKGEYATETFAYTIADQHGATDTAHVTVKIWGVNDAPVAQHDQAHTNERSHTDIDVLANDFDPDKNDTIRVVGVDTKGLAGKAWINPMGGITYDPAGKFTHLGKGEYATETLTYTIADQHGATGTAKVKVHVWGKNDAPVANDDKVETDEKSGVTIHVLANDFDPDQHDTIQVVDVEATGLAGELTYLGNGKFHYDPAGQFDHLAKGQTAVETFRYTIADQHGATDTATAEIVIHGVNDAPVAVDDFFTGFLNIGFYAPIAALLANDFDIDDGDTIHFAGLGNAVNGDVMVTPDGYVVFIPDADFTGLAGFQYAIQDQHGAFDIGTVFLDVVPITPGVIEYQTLSWFSAISDANVQSTSDGLTVIDLAIEMGAVAAAGVELGGMPFFSVALAGVLQGVIQVALLPDGTTLATGDLVGDLDLQMQVSPIFQPLGGDLYDALFLAIGGAPYGYGWSGGSAPQLPDFGLGNPLWDLVEQMVQAIDLGGIDALIAGQGMGDTNAVAFGNGVFYLDIKGLLTGAVSVPNELDGEPLVEAAVWGEFIAAALVDIRDDLTVIADGMFDGGFNVTMAMPGLASSAIATLVSEEQTVIA